MVTLVRTEYVEIDGLSFGTPALLITDHASLKGGTPTVGNDRRIARVNGAKMGEYWLDRSVRQLPLFVTGLDDDGEPYDDYEDLRDGLTYNINRVLTALRPRPNGVLLKLHRRDGTVIQGYAHFRTPLNIGHVGPAAARGVIEAVIPAGVLRSDTAVVANNTVNANLVTVPNPGSVDQTAVEITASGPCVLTNTTTGTVLTVTGEGGIEIHTDPLNFSITDSGGRADGRVTRSGSVNYFPLAVGSNVVEVTHPDSPAPLTDVTIRHFAAFA
jgi:hypothetical protein